MWMVTDDGQRVAPPEQDFEEEGQDGDGGQDRDEGQDGDGAQDEKWWKAIIRNFLKI
jgi:hypothetical protein